MLLNHEYNTQLERDGFVVVPFLNHEALQQLRSAYLSVHNNEEPPQFIDNIHMTTWCSDANYKSTVNGLLRKIFEEPTRANFIEHRTLNHVFIVKRSGQNTVFKVHQDWNIVDELKFKSVNVWVPLHDVDEYSGALWVIKGSHKIARPIRGSGYLFPDYSKFNSELEKHAVSVSLKAGEAIVFYHSIIHGSPPNLSDKERQVACFSVIPHEANLCIYFQPKEGEPLKQYEPEDDFVFKYEHLRTETLTRPPSEHPSAIYAPLINAPVTLAELEVFLQDK